MLEISALTTAYEGLVALSDVRLSVAAGEIVAVIGANGAGKSTLLKSLVGILRLDSGTVMLGDHDVTGRAPEELARIAVAQLGAARRIEALESGPGALDRLLALLGPDAKVVRTLAELEVAQPASR